MADLETRNALVEVGCAYWFNDNGEVRSPFPVEIQSDVKRRAHKPIASLNWNRYRIRERIFRCEPQNLAHHLGVPRMVG